MNLFLIFHKYVVLYVSNRSSDRESNFFVSRLTMTVPTPHRFFRGWHFILLRGRRPFRLYFVVVVSNDRYEQYLICIRQLF